LTVNDLTVLSGNHVRVPLLAEHYKLVHVFLAHVYVLYMNANLRTPAKVEQAVIAQLAIHFDGSYVVPATIDIDGLALPLSKADFLGRLNVSINK
jgi:hypothetical protein